jgi:spermidine synthase
MGRCLISLEFFVPDAARCLRPLNRYATRRTAGLSGPSRPLPGVPDLMAFAMTSSPSRQHHILADLWDCPADVLRDENRIRDAMLEAARRGGATIVDSTFHRFEGGGITGVVAVKESHLTIHTWPERGFAAVDVFFCGATNPEASVRYLVRNLHAKRTDVQHHVRGDVRAIGGERAKHPDGARAAAGGRGRLGVLYGVTVIVAMCSLVYELLLAQTLSALLGNTVLRYSITIGCYLGALGVGAILCGTRPDDADRRLVRVELALCALGGLSVPLFHVFDMGQRYLFLNSPVGSAWEWIGPWGFLFLTHAVIVGIGLLSGFEVPLLLALGEDIRPGSTSRVLGVDYFGALLGSVLFPLVFLRTFGLLATAFLIALANAVAAFVLIVWRPLEGRLRFGLIGAALTVGLVIALGAANGIEQYFLKKFYYAGQATDLLSLVEPVKNEPDIVRYRSPYQAVDLVHDPIETQWLYDSVIDRAPLGDGYPQDLWLYLDRQFQFFSGADEVYHEWFVHAAVEGNGHLPRKALVLGGGDGLALRELLKYRSIERIVHVELDPQMIWLADHDPLVSLMNHHAHQDPRVEVVNADAFSWLRNNDELFDAVFIDMPNVKDYNHSMVYSREFYSLARHHVTADGFVVIDTPDGSCYPAAEGSLWGVYYNTLRAAGFPSVHSLRSVFDLHAPRIVGAVDRLAGEMTLQVPLPGGGEAKLDREQTREYMEGAVKEELDGNLHEFVVAFPTKRAVNTKWFDPGVPLLAFGPRHLAVAFDDSRCDYALDPSLVNSIFRPTLPVLELASIILR